MATELTQADLDARKAYHEAARAEHDDYYASDPDPTVSQTPPEDQEPDKADE